MPAESHCPLCGSQHIHPFHRDKHRSYRRCARCALVHVPAAERLDLLSERAQYDLHRNSADDPGYRRFLMRLVEPLAARLPPGAAGLDFGCGPGPALASILREKGFSVALYDPYYACRPALLQRSYDFVCATEVVEHLHAPGEELDRLWALLRGNGWLGIMTKLVSGRAAFADWHYIRDPTHVCFFSVATWQWWAEQRGAALEIIGQDVMVLGKPG